MNHQSRFDDKHDQSQHQRQAEAMRPLEFATPEELLRFDAQKTRVPEAIQERLSASAAAAHPRPPWWKRWFQR